VRRWLIEKLPLRYVNPAAWDLRRTRQDRDPPGGSPRESRWLWLRNLFRDEDGEDVDEGGGDNVVDAQKREKISRTGTSVSVRGKNLFFTFQYLSLRGLQHPETKDITPFVDNAARIIVSVTAGLFLLVPMIVLSFITSQKARLGTTVAFVIVFAVVLGRFSKATNDALMGATAAYAAVLVVFVGQTTPIS
jgi:hypothetical protein